MILSRRKLIGGVSLLFSAPAIVRAESLMPIKAVTYVDLSGDFELFASSFERPSWAISMPGVDFRNYCMKGH